MDDRLKESISALMDDEANELELQRVLSHAEKDELLDTWKTYHSIKSVLQHEQEDFLAIDVTQAVSQAIAQEAPLQINDDLNKTLEDTSVQTNESFSSTRNSALQSPSDNPVSDTNIHDDSSKLMTKISSGFAIAASIFVAFVFVLQNGVDGRSSVNDNLIASVPASLSVNTNAPGFQNVGTLTASSDSLSVSKKQPKIIVEFTEEHARRFNEYLLRHAEHSVASSHAGMIPLARVASVNAVGI